VRPPCFYGKTEGSTPFRFSLHVGDVGHTLIVGPTGAGKSVLLALMALQFRRYAAAQVFAFDFGGSIRAAALAMGGDWQDLGGGLTEGDGVRLAAAARADRRPAERAWAAEWLAAILASRRRAVDPQVKEHLWSALTSLASAPVAERTHAHRPGRAAAVQALKQALAPYCVGGPYGRLLDAEAEHLGEASCAGVRDRRADRHRGGARRAVLSVPPHRGTGSTARRR
jgi:type IV secretory pathway VirB4 component